MNAVEPADVPRRSRRDRAVDVCVILFAAIFVFATAMPRIEETPLPPEWLLVPDILCGVLGTAALTLRRRWPVHLAVAMLPFSMFAETMAGAQAVAIFTVAVHRPVKVTALLGGLSLATAPVYIWLRPDPQLPGIAAMTLAVTVSLGVIGWGLFIRHRRQLILSLRERAIKAESEAHLLAEQAQHRAREQIAREMHDVLGHRLSLLSVHAGALEYRPDAPPEEIAHAAAVIRASAHQALQDLREVIGVLRAPEGELPQPTVADIRELVAESGRAGMRVDLRAELAGPVPDSVGRTAYRIVQEGLTNARKHAPDSPVSVTLAGAQGSGLTVEVCNPAPRPTPTAPAPTPGSGQGLIGLTERAVLAAGRLEHGRTATGGFRLAAWLPWPPT